MREKYHRDLATDCMRQAQEAKTDADRQQLLLLAADHLKVAQEEQRRKLNAADRARVDEENQQAKLDNEKTK